MKKRGSIKSNEDCKPELNQDSFSNSHLEGYTEDEIRLIKLISEIVVKAVVNHKTN